MAIRHPAAWDGGGRTCFCRCPPAAMVPVAGRRRGCAALGEEAVGEGLAAVAIAVVVAREGSRRGHFPHRPRPVSRLSLSPPAGSLEPFPILLLPLCRLCSASIAVPVPSPSLLHPCPCSVPVAAPSLSLLCPHPCSILVPALSPSLSLLLPYSCSIRVPAPFPCLLHPHPCSVSIPDASPSLHLPLPCSILLPALSLSLFQPHLCLFRQVFHVSQQIWALPPGTPLLLRWHFWVPF